MNPQMESKVLHLRGFDSFDEAKQYLEEAGTEIKLNGFTENDRLKG